MAYRIRWEFQTSYPRRATSNLSLRVVVDRLSIFILAEALTVLSPTVLTDVHCEDLASPSALNRLVRAKDKGLGEPVTRSPLLVIRVRYMYGQVPINLFNKEKRPFQLHSSTLHQPKQKVETVSRLDFNE